MTFDWTLLISFVVPALIAAVKTLVPWVPKAVLPILAPLAGAAVELVGYLVGMWPSDPLRGAVFGALGVFIREVYDQLRKALAA